MLDSLRNEIVESQKARTDLLKWKLILVAVIGAAAFGIGSNVPSQTGSSPSPPVVLLALVPFVCFYVDAVCLHNDIRILLIARFIRRGTLGPVATQYERYCIENRRHFSIESVALVVTTTGLSALVALIGLSDWLPPAVQPFVREILAISGIIGVVLGPFFHWGVYARRKRALDDDAPAS